MPNRLASETSPYLLQHAENPVDWYPWGEDAFARARAEDKPVLVSIGYAACHWCHVMERESFENPAIAAAMNERFVCVKVDREERPDVDAIYMDAVQAMTGAGGWPLHAFLTPDGVPFFTGTYFPPEPRGEVPAWGQVIQALGHAWSEQRADVEQAAAQILPRLQGTAFMEAPDAELDPRLLERAATQLQHAFDAEHGGWGGAPKFPSTSVIELLLARGERMMALQSLRRMAAGGIYDQVGGGFARYTVDAAWVVPHFEKMLYDNALLARAYLHAYQVSDEPLFKRVCEETLDWALRELRLPEGGFASSLDADSDGVEGRFYVWTPAQLRGVLGAELAAVAIAHFGVTEAGNFEGANVLVRATADPPQLAEIKAKLLAAREARTRPALDDKRLTSWNALAIAALADAGAALERADYLEAAVAAAEFVETSLRGADGRLLRSFNRGQAKLDGLLEDHAYLLEAYLTLYEATFDARWFTRARELAELVLERYHDGERGGFYAVAADAGLIARRKDLEDAPIPSGSSAAAFGLLRLARMTGESRYEDAALSLVRLLHTIAPEHPLAFGHLLRAIDFLQAPVREVALAGDELAPLARVVRGRFRPHVVLAGGDGDGVPLLEGRGPVDGRAAAYVCERFACQAPVTEPAELEALLSA